MCSSQGFDCRFTYICRSGLLGFLLEIVELLPRSWQLLLFSNGEKYLHSISRLGGEAGRASSLGIDRSEIVYGSAPTEVIMRTGDESGGMHAGIVAVF